MAGQTNKPNRIIPLLYFSDLSWIERLLKSLQFTTYMKELRKVYNNAYHEPKEPPCIFKGRYRNCERAYHQRYKGDDVRTVASYHGFSQKEWYHHRNKNKLFLKIKYFFSFNFKKPGEQPYIPILVKGSRIKEIVRDVDSRYNISMHDFDVTMRKVEPKKLVPDYFIDYWNKISEVDQFQDYM